jgi:hypothetical protein
MASAPTKDVVSDGKKDVSKSETSAPVEPQSGPGDAFDFSAMACLLNAQAGQGGTVPSPFVSPGAGGNMGNPFDFSAMSGLLNDPSINELSEQIAKGPSFTKMAEMLQQTFQGAPAAEEGIPQFDSQQYYSTMQNVMQNPQFMTMAERLGNAFYLRFHKIRKKYPKRGIIGKWHGPSHRLSCRKV